VLETKGIVKSYNGRKVLDDTSLSIEKGEIRVIIGLNGCGKSTLLKIIAGIIPPDQGTVTIDGRDVTALSPEERGVGYVPQSTALFHHLTVDENIRYSRFNGRGSDDVAETVITMMNLRPYLAKKPRELSGGFRARVALARALFSEPSVMLLDEPMTEVDHAKKEQVLPEFRTVLRELKVPVLYITHDPREAQLVGERFSVMDEGKIRMIDSTEEAFEAIRTIALRNADCL